MSTDRFRQKQPFESDRSASFFFFPKTIRVMDERTKSIQNEALWYTKAILNLRVSTQFRVANNFEWIAKNLKT